MVGMDSRGRAAVIRMLAPMLAGLVLVLVPLAAFGYVALFVPPVPPGIDAPWHQVRIEQHIIIRIAPGLAMPDRPLLPPPPLPSVEHLRHRAMPPCMPVAAIAGVRPMEGNRLLLFMRDHRLVRAELGRRCNAHDFYQGFYVSPTGDGMLCAGRDTIHSRSGSNCAIARVRELIPDE